MAWQPAVCSDGFEFRCDNGEPLRVTFALDCRDREAMSWAATTAGHSGDIVRDVVLAAVENRFGNVLHTESEIEWLRDNGSGYTVDETRQFSAARLEAADHAGVQPTEQRHGGTLREDHEA